MPDTVVVIHGVGDAEPGEAGREVARRLGFGVVEETHLQVGPHPLIRLRDAATDDRVIEVNWADLLRSRASALGVLRHVVLVVLSVLDVACRPPRGGGTMWCAGVYRFALLTVTPSAFLFVTTTAVAVCTVNLWQRLVILFVLLVGWGLLAVVARRYGRHFSGLWLGFAATAVVFGATIVYGDALPAGHWLVRVSGHARVAGVLGVTIVHLVAALETAVRRRRSGVWVVLAHLAFLYIPYLAVSTLLTCVGAAALTVVATTHKYQEWEWNVLAGSLDAAKEANDRLALVELVTTVGVFAIGLLSVVVLLGWFAVKAQQPADSPPVNRRGLGAQRGLAGCLVATPVILLCVGALDAWVTGAKIETVREVLNSVPDYPHENMSETYRTSVLRAVPYLLWLVGPAAVVLGILGDLAFYLQPNPRHPAAIAARCRARLAAAVRLALRDGGPVVVLAHSQGAKIAADMRARGRLPCALVTAGAPVAALYVRFVGAALPPPDKHPWVNCYRDADVIAGVIPVAGVSNVHLGRGGHTGYWSKPSLAAVLRRLLDEQMPAAPP